MYRAKFVILFVLATLLIVGTSSSKAFARVLLEKQIQESEDKKQWQIYQDPDYGFQVEYPITDWEVENIWNKKDVASTAIAKRVSFFGPLAEISINIWEAPREDLLDWYRYYAEKLDMNPVSEPNATIAGASAIAFVDENVQSPTMLNVIFNSDSNFYMIEYYMSDGGTAMETYMHFLQTFKITLADRKDQTENFYFPREVQDYGLQNINVIMTQAASECCGYTQANNPFPCDDGNCTWWSFYRKVHPIRGDAWKWGHTVEMGMYPDYYFSETPRHRHFAWWDRNSCWSNAGHVAYITGKSGSNTWIRVSEMTWQGTPCNEEPRSRTISIPSCEEPTGYLIER